MELRLLSRHRRDHRHLRHTVLAVSPQRLALSRALGNNWQRLRDQSVQENHIRGHDQLILPGAEVISRRIIGMLVSQLGPEQAGVFAPDIQPMPQPDRVRAVARLRTGPLPSDILTFFLQQPYTTYIFYPTVPTH